MKNLIKLPVAIVLLCLTVSLANAQDTIFYDDFSTNAKEWDTTNTGIFRLAVEAQRYYFECKKKDESLMTSKKIALDSTQDYTVSCTIKKLKGVNNNGFGLLIGSPDHQNDYNFLISGNGYYNIIRWENGEPKTLVDWTESPLIECWDSALNQLQVVHSGRYLKFFINERYVTRVRHQPDFGRKVGFVVHQNIAIAIEEVSVVQKPAIVEADNFAKLQLTGLQFVSNEGKAYLTGGQAGELKFKLTNAGPDTAYDIEIRLNEVTENSHLNYHPLKLVEQLPKDSTLNLSYEIAADYSSPSQFCAFSLEVTDVNQLYPNSRNISFDTKSIYEEQEEVPVETDEKFDPEACSDECFDECFDSCGDECFDGCGDNFFESFVGLMINIFKK